MTTKGAQYSIDGTAVKLLSSSNHYQELIIHTDGSIFIGDSNAVTTNNGFKMDVGIVGNFTVAPYTEIWAISNGGTAKTAYTMTTVI